MPREEFHSITDIVEAVYCEQKLVFDRAKGRATPLHVQVKAQAGVIEHYRFQVEGHTRKALDQRCYIASHVFGVDAPETEACRRWRDRTFARFRLGRAVIQAYYLASPALIPVKSAGNLEPSASGGPVRQSLAAAVERE